MTKADTKKRIIDCALTLFSQNGYKATTVKEIASLANVNEITVFRHFQTKEGLLDEIFRPYSSISNRYDMLFGHLTGNLTADLRHICTTLIDMVLENMLFMKFCIIEVSFNSSIATEVLKILTSYTTHLTEYLNYLSEQRVIPKSNFQLISQMFLNLVHQYAFSKLDQINSFSPETPEKEEFIDTMVELFVTKLH